MSNLANLPADEASTLRLLAGGKNPSDVAEALAIDLNAVMARAQRGADSLAGPLSRDLAESERARVVSALFGLSADEPLLTSSPAAQAYASAVEEALGIRKPAPAETPTEVFTPVRAQSPKPVAAKPSPRPATTVPSAKNEPKSERSPERTRGIILLSCLAVVIVGIVIALVAPGGESTKKAADQTASTTTPTQNGGWQIRNRFTLKAVDGGSGKALAGIETKGEASALLIAGNGLAPSSTVGIWLLGGSSAGLIGFQTVNSKGQFSAVGPLPKNLQSADTLAVTRETVKPGEKAPTTPGPVVLSSPFSLS